MKMATPASNQRANALENIVLLDRTSILLVVTGEDAANVAGFYADIRGLIVNDNRKVVAKDAIALRLQVSKELKPEPDSIGYSHRAADMS